MNYYSKYHPPKNKKKCELCGEEFLPVGGRASVCPACKEALTNWQIHLIKSTAAVRYVYYRNYRKYGVRKYVAVKPEPDSKSDASQCKTGCMYHSYCGSDACCLYTAIKGYTRKSQGDTTPCGKHCKSYKKGKPPLCDWVQIR